MGNGILFTQNKGDNPLNTGSAWNPTVVYNAEGSQTVIDGNYKNLVLSGGGTKSINPTGNNVHIVDLLSVLSSTELVTNNKLVISATLNSQGAIGPLLDGANISGNVRVNHYIKNGVEAKRGTRSLSSPIDDSSIADKTFKQLKEWVIITGPGSTTNGFDAGSSAASLVTYYEPAHPQVESSFRPVTNINTSSTPGHGFQLFFRGNRVNLSLKLTSTQLTENVIKVQ